MEKQHSSGGKETPEKPGRALEKAANLGTATVPQISEIVQKRKRLSLAKLIVQQRTVFP